MRKLSRLMLVVAVLVVFQARLAQNGLGEEPKLALLQQSFKDYSGADLVFHRDDLPDGR